MNTLLSIVISLFLSIIGVIVVTFATCLIMVCASIVMAVKRECSKAMKKAMEKDESNDCSEVA